MAQIHAQLTIAASPERVFDWLLDPTNLSISPVIRKARWANGSSGPGVGAVREVTGFGFWLHEEITAYDEARSYSYRVVGSFPPSEHQGGAVTCTPTGDGTDVTWVSGYTVPVRGGGKVMEVATAPLIRSLIFRAVLAGCAKALQA